MSRFRAYAMVGALFLLGVLVGVFATHAFYARQLQRPGGIADVALTVLGADLRRSLELDPAQEAVLEEVLDDARDDLGAIRGEVVARIRATRARSFERLAKVLRPDQLEHLERFRARQTERLEALVGDSLSRRSSAEPPADAAPATVEEAEQSPTPTP